ncbi:DUF1552 domain-containing protein [Polyangium aurulentum]|uniref:DUF1552 domain-containing protein n=1 Tax=Polyangium aurulentum TaxID=2567896 RepID=UPI0010AE6A3C|nr:DUF1552 domain-containing protein [Polyangium aurulentum]UQA58178.1 DUF1552 domain-containing protein [Polyangium aurulentum]
MITRRRLLQGLFGVTVALPFLESLAPKKAKAASDVAPFAIFLRQANGVVQQTNDEPEMYWPSKTGTLTTASMQAEPGRATSELADYADKLILLKGINFAFNGNGCGHSGGGNQCLTAAKVSADPSGNLSLSMGESLDNRIASQLNPTGIEPLTLYAGKKSGYIDEVMSYRGPKQLRSAQENPFKAYMDLFGLSALTPEAFKQLQAQRKSVNDLVREQMQSLMSGPDLSKADHERLDLHFQSIRDLENKLICSLGTDDVQSMKDIEAACRANDNIPMVTRMQIDVIALAMACGVTRAATLQIGDGNDSTQYIIDGVKQKSFHRISHRIDSDGSVGEPIANAVGLHHEIDRIHLRHFKYLLDKLNSYDMGSGKLLDFGVAVLLNDLANLYHSYHDVPYVMAGGAGGFLKTGQYLDVNGVNNNKLLNTIGTAVGCTNAAGGPLDDFGDPELEKGLISEIMAG